MTEEEDEERGPGGMDAIPDEPVDDSEEPGGMSAIVDADPPARDRPKTKD